MYAAPPMMMVPSYNIGTPTRHIPPVTVYAAPPPTMGAIPTQQPAVTPPPVPVLTEQELKLVRIKLTYFF